MLASFIASNYAYYAASQGYTQGVVYQNYLNPQFAGYSSVMAKNSALGHMTSMTPNTEAQDQENFSDELRKSVNCQKTSIDSSVVKFSIARILGETSTTSETSNDVDEGCGNVDSEQTSDDIEDGLQYSWLHCTRYKPPKLQRKDLFIYLINFIYYLNLYIYLFNTKWKPTVGNIWSWAVSATWRMMAK